MNAAVSYPNSDGWSLGNKMLAFDCFFFFEDNQCKLFHAHPKKLTPWFCQQMELCCPLWSRFSISVHCFDCFLYLVWSVASLTMNRRKKWALFVWNIGKDSIETCSWHVFCSVESRRGTHLTHSFLVSNFSVDMRCTPLFEMPTMYDGFCISSNTILGIFFTISGVVTSFGRPQRCSPWQLLRHRLNSATKYFIL